MALVGGLPKAIADLKDAGVLVIGLDERGDKTLWDLQVGSGPVALVLGAEGPGLSAEAVAGCDVVVGISQFGSTRSVNVGAAAAVVMHAWVRRWVFDQRVGPDPRGRTDSLAAPPA